MFLITEAIKTSYIFTHFRLKFTPFQHFPAHLFPTCSAIISYSTEWLINTTYVFVSYFFNINSTIVNSDIITVVSESTKWNCISSWGWDFIHSPQIIVDINITIDTIPNSFNKTAMWLLSFQLIWKYIFINDSK